MPKAKAKIITEQTFDSWGEFLTYVREAPLVGTGLQSQRPNDGDIQTESFAEATDLALTGWKAGEEKVHRIARTFIDRLASRIARDDIVYDVEGIDFDVARILTGEPECWQRIETTMAEGFSVKHVKIVLNCSASQGIDAAIITMRGAAIAALAELLEIAGARVTVDVINSVKGYDSTPYLLTVHVKHAGQPLDLGHLVFAMAHPSMLRRLVWRAKEACGYSKAYGYGSPYDPPREEEPGTIYLRGATIGEPQWYDTKSAQAWVLETLQEQGITLKEEPT